MIKELIENIARIKRELEYALEENGGELTDELKAQADTLEEMKELLAGQGIDDLGRWFKSVQDEIAARKAEADAAARKVKSLKSYEEYVKWLIGQAMDALDLPYNKNGEKVAKGSFYGFKRTTSTKSSVDQEGLDTIFLPKIEESIGAMFPSWLHFAVKTTTTELREAGGDALAFLEENYSPAISFTKPRANKEAKDGKAD